MTFQDLLVIAGSVVGFTAFMIFKDDLFRWVAARRRARPVKHFEQRHGTVMSYAGGSAPIERPTELVRVAPVRPDTYQEEPEERAEKKDIPDLSISHNMDNRTLTLIMAAQKTLDGKPRWSANEICKMIGGTRQDVLDTIAIVRPREKVVEAPPAKPSPAISPIAGRALPAHASFHSDNPELEYQAPD